MATLSITIPDDQVSRVLAAFTARKNMVNSAGGPATAADVRAELVAFVRSVTLGHERKARATAAEAEVTPIDVT